MAEHFCGNCHDTGLVNHQEISSFHSAVDGAISAFREEGLHLGPFGREPAEEYCEECPTCEGCGVLVSEHQPEEAKRAIHIRGKYFSLPNC